MRSTDRHHYDIRRLHVWMTLSSLGLLAVTVWMVLADHYRPWKDYQRTYRDRIEPWLTEVDAIGRPLAVDQIWLPDLTIDYNFRDVARFDRCATCHQGIAKVVVRRGVPQPYCAHPRLDLFLGSQSPHPMAEFGCTICHDGQGSATGFALASHTPNDPSQGKRWRRQYDWFRNEHWDLPMLPGRFAESRCLKCHHEVVDLEPSERFPDPPAAKLLAGYDLVRRYGCFGCHEIKGVDDAGRSVGPDMRLEPVGQAWKPDEAVGQASKPDPQSENVRLESLTYPGTMRKVGPSLRHVADRLDGKYLVHWIAEPARLRPATRMPRFFGLHEHLDGRALDEARRFEAVELRAIAEYLLTAGQKAAPLPTPEGVTETPSPERGKRLFQLHGCLACHRHAEYPDSQGVQGPDLSNLGAKYTTDAGRQWLVGWIRNPQHASPRALMPNALLEPVAAGEGKATDPAADVAAYLLSFDRGPSLAEPAPVVAADIDDLAAMYLAKTLPEDEAEQKKLRNVGRRSIARRGCYGCHDIPGFEKAQRIGPALSEWGRKQESLLAFEQINQYVASRDPEPPGDPDREFFRDALLAHRREGFLWQKLREPRSFDYRKAPDKPYSEWLLMGRFGFTDQEVEAISTFVLGFVADPPAEKYVYRPEGPAKAIVEGRKVLAKYACAECHTLEMERWSFTYDPEEFAAPALLPDYPFMKPQVSPQQIAASLVTDDRGLGHAVVTGMPQVDAGGRLQVVDEDEDKQGNEIRQYGFSPWQPGAIAGRVYGVGGPDLLVWSNQIAAKRPPVGGQLARLLYPFALADGRASGANPTGPEAWGWGPPPLVGEGAKVQPAWLHEYLLRPTVIRPAAVLRMPQYNMSPREAAAMVDYFAAVAGADFPYPAPVGQAFQPVGQASQPDMQSRPDVQGREPRRPDDRLDRAMKIVTDKVTFCAKCHLIGAYSPGGSIRTTLAPNLDEVHRRLRPDYVRRWVANPRATLPYTGMPVNFPPTGPPKGQDLFPGSSSEQRDAVTELLLRYDWYLKRRGQAASGGTQKTEADGTQKTEPVE